ncbi:MAG: hypothetical protein FP825_11760 [Hyphomonas sp.]|uniref:hypothetical protein n=1 Tax=Hyphomonas sp. TaxID=87 RepID=UPI00180541DA|nr:hypothetical protein [Hyphomonas sp.]MBA3069143.1 hypothetical protein [Hyphomonas sp.]MBU3921210.1 hypothetical protein [Alphaproteobacteria bacterium]MBU4062327.1 hypothetical protein [Alphaproteobacteria bacterium]MBU4162709.1 hypothetical protein [Alphaproteobacteria bacterium]
MRNGARLSVRDLITAPAHPGKTIRHERKGGKVRSPEFLPEISHQWLLQPGRLLAEIRNCSVPEPIFGTSANRASQLRWQRDAGSDRHHEILAQPHQKARWRLSGGPKELDIPIRSRAGGAVTPAAGSGRCASCSEHANHRKGCTNAAAFNDACICEDDAVVSDVKRGPVSKWQGHLIVDADQLTGDRFTTVCIVWRAGKPPSLFQCIFAGVAGRGFAENKGILFAAALELI